MADVDTTFQTTGQKTKTNVDSLTSGSAGSSNSLISLFGYIRKVVIPGKITHNSVRIYGISNLLKPTGYMMHQQV